MISVVLFRTNCKNNEIRSGLNVEKIIIAIFNELIIFDKDLKPKRNGVLKVFTLKGIITKIVSRIICHKNRNIKKGMFITEMCLPRC